MKNLMLTTAIVAVTSMGAVAQTADTSAPAGTTAAQTSAVAQTVPAFMSSAFTGQTLYTLDSDAARGLRDAQATDGERVRWESGPILTENRDAWENVGNIADMVITQDGDVRGVLIDVGGFLGLGARTVMIDMDELYFVAEDPAAEGGDEGYAVVVPLSKAQLEALPEWDDAQLSTGYEPRGAASMMEEAQPTTEQAQAEPAALPEGYAVMQEQDRTAERLTGADAYTSGGEEIATVSDLVLEEDGTASHVVMDVGGFLGMGSHTVAIAIEQVDILWNDSDDEVRVQVPLTEEQLRALPAYEES